ncbi:MAG: TetR/AcrR family transcriptional regulator [Elusimicrobiales bacterium]|nr:TetR/AcrR family transcriptional regulator [Elusimicrobiales bacterium]
MKIKGDDKMKILIENRKKQILDAAVIVFSKDGFSRANTDDIAKRAKLGKGTVFRYFKNKKILFCSVVDRGLDSLKNEIMSEIEKVSDPLEKIEKIIESYLSFFEKNKNLIGILIHEQSSFQKRIASQYLNHYYGNVDRIKLIFKEALSQGLIKRMDINKVITVLTGLLNGIVYMWQVEGRKGKLTDRVSIILEIFFTGIIKNKARGKKYGRISV